MSNQWQFVTDADAQTFCEEIAAELQHRFGVTRDEAIGRINRHWRGLTIVGQDIVYHETTEYWAHVMYYGKDSFWWITGERRKELDLSPITPSPYP